MIRLHHFLGLALYFAVNFPVVKGSSVGDRANKHGIIHETSHRNPALDFRRSLYVARDLVEVREETVDVSVETLNDILNQIKALEDRVLALFPSGSRYTSASPSSTQIESPSQNQLDGQVASSSISNSVSGGAFIETAQAKSPTLSADIELVDDESFSESIAVNSDSMTSIQASLTESTQSSSDGGAFPSETSEVLTVGQTGDSGDSQLYPSSTSNSSAVETRGPDPSEDAATTQSSSLRNGISGDDVENGVSEDNSLVQESDFATGAAWATAPGQNSSMTSIIGMHASATGYSRTSYAADGKTMYFDTPEPYTSTASSVGNEQASTLREPTDSLESQGSQGLTTITFTSTITKSSAVVMTTTLTKLLPLQQTPSSAIFFESMGHANTTTRSPSANQAAAGTLAVESETPSFVSPIMRVPGHNATADGPLPSGFRTLSKPTSSVGEEEA